jgi:hypothetical protein
MQLISTPAQSVFASLYLQPHDASPATSFGWTPLKHVPEISKYSGPLFVRSLVEQPKLPSPPPPTLYTISNVLPYNSRWYGGFDLFEATSDQIWYQTSR